MHDGRRLVKIIASRPFPLTWKTGSGTARERLNEPPPQPQPPPIDCHRLRRRDAFLTLQSDNNRNEIII